jgi:hypothetical protein
MVNSLSLSLSLSFLLFLLVVLFRMFCMHFSDLISLYPPNQHSTSALLALRALLLQVFV